MAKTTGPREHTAPHGPITILGGTLDWCLCAVEERPVESGDVAAVPLACSSRGLLGPVDTVRWRGVVRLAGRPALDHRGSHATAEEALAAAREYLAEVAS